ncbi:hypothetical protein ACFP8W_21535 [Nocardioides hankookensis]|uniref:Uncharacterized protein n=1 Tax=Nocardioides hankookensis TaxID=443157 RepID=A0ABW1LHQ8_9ACTN
MRRYLWAITVLVLLVLSVVLFAMSTDDGDYGWFAYAPGSGEIDLGRDIVLMSRTRVAAWAATALALIVLAAGTGFALGRRTRRDP